MAIAEMAVPISRFLLLTYLNWIVNVKKVPFVIGLFKVELNFMFGLVSL